MAKGKTRRRIEFDPDVWHALDFLGRDSRKTLQELADEAFRDLLRKHRRPTTLKEAFRESSRRHPANDDGPSRRSFSRSRRRGSE